MNSGLVKDFVITPALYSSVLQSSTLSSVFSNQQSLTAILNYSKNSGELNDISKAKKNMLSLAINLYFIQLIHSAIKGYFWAQNVTQTASGEIVNEGINLNLTPYSALSHNLKESKSEIKYVILF